MLPNTKTRTLTRDIGPLSIRAEVVPGSIDEEKRTVELTWSTGARVMRGFFERYWEELSMQPKHIRMDRLKSGNAPLLDTHDGYACRGVIGVVEKSWIKDKAGGAKVRFAKAEDDENAEKIFRKIVDKILRNVSVGYRVHRLEKVEDADDKIPVYRATDWEPYEISIVPMGADAGASVRAESAETNPCTFVIDEPQEQRTMDPEQQPAAPAKNDEHRAAVDEKAVREQAIADERKRSAGIQAAARALKIGDDFVRTHIDKGTSLDEFRKLAIDEHERATPPICKDDGRVSAVPGGDARDKWMRGAGDWLIFRASVGEHVVKAAEKRGEKIMIDPGEFRGLSMIDLARQCLERAGTRTAGMDKMRIIGEALTMRGAGYAATGDFPVLLENTMHKVLLAAYGITADTWSLFCDIGSVSDFRAHNRYRTGSFGNLSTVSEHGEFTNLSVPDGEKESITAATKGNIVGLTRQALINDDMSAFGKVAMSIGRAAARTIEADVYALLALNAGLGPAMADGSTLFHDANHSNIGSASALGVAALDADRVVMAEQMDPSERDFLDLRPAILLVPLGLGAQARVLNDAQYDIDAIDAGTDEANKFMKPNSVRGLFRTIVDTPRLSGTRRYLFADPSIAPVIEVAFLDGQREPYMEVQNGWRVDGVEWKIRLDYGVGAIDYRGAVTNAGQ